MKLAIRRDVVSAVTVIFGTRARPSPLMKVIVIGLLWLVSIMAIATYGGLWLIQPVAGALVLSHVIAFFAGLAWRDRRRAMKDEQVGYLDETVEAKNLADAAVDGQHVNTNPDGKTLFGIAAQRPVVMYCQTPAETLPDDVGGIYGVRL